MLLTWNLTVDRLTKRRSAMSGLLSPDTMSRRISSSRVVSPSASTSAGAVAALMSTSAASGASVDRPACAARMAPASSSAVTFLSR